MAADPCPECKGRGVIDSETSAGDHYLLQCPSCRGAAPAAETPRCPACGQPVKVSTRDGRRWWTCVGSPGRAACGHSAPAAETPRAPMLDFTCSFCKAAPCRCPDPSPRADIAWRDSGVIGKRHGKCACGAGWDYCTDMEADRIARVHWNHCPRASAETPPPRDDGHEPDCLGWEDCRCFPTAAEKERDEARAALAALRARVDEALDDVLACADSAMWAGKPIGPGAVWAFREVVLAVRAALSGEGR